MQHHAHSPSAIPPRDIKFNLEENCPRDWYDNDPVISRFYDGMSLIFPEGEKYFIESVRHFKNEIKDENLLEDIANFTRQEAYHSREHAAYNAFLNKNGLPSEELEQNYIQIVNKVRGRMSWSEKLASTCAAEHITAMLADSLLTDKVFDKKSHPAYRELWKWHSVEEIEHKAVAFDVYRATHKGAAAYFLRIGKFIKLATIFNIRFAHHWAVLLRSSGDLNFKAFVKLTWYLWGKPGLYRRQIFHALAYLKPNFHPWDHDNRALIDEWKQAKERQPLKSVT